MSESELALLIAAEHTGREPSSDHFRRLARAELKARGADLRALRKAVAELVARLRTLSDEDLVMVVFDPAHEATGIWRLGMREWDRREAERGCPLRWEREAWDRYNRERIAKGQQPSDPCNEGGSGVVAPTSPPGARVARGRGD